MQENIMRDMPLFVEVAAQKNFSQAADSLGVPVSTLSRRIARMEKELGVRLFNRNSRTVQLTEAGSAFYERCKFIVLEAAEAHEALVYSATTPAGTVRVSAPADFVRFMGDILLDFARKYPKIRLDIQEKDNWSDLMSDRFDLEVRVGNLPDSNLVARQLARFRLGIFAAPELLQRHPVPLHPRDFLQLPTITLRQEPRWTLVKEGVTEEITLHPAYRFSNGSAILEFTLAGMGFAALGSDLAAHYVGKGRLVPVLGDWQFSQKPVYIVVPGRQMPARVALFVDYIMEQVRTRKDRTPFSERLDAHK